MSNFVRLAAKKKEGRRSLGTFRVVMLAMVMQSLALIPARAAVDVIINEFAAENVHGITDEDRETEDWIELYNRGTLAANLSGWSLTDDPDAPDQWILPAITLPPNSYLVIFASGKDRKPVTAGSKLHTNFKLGIEGEYLALFNNAIPRQRMSEFAPAFPVQRIDYSYGRDSGGTWRYFAVPTPGKANGASLIRDLVAPVVFSVKHSFIAQPINLALSSATAGAILRYTLDGSEPTESNGIVYNGVIPINQTRIVRAAAFKANLLPSKSVAQTYLYNLPAAQRALPVVSLVTATNNLYGPTGIMGIGGGTYAADGTWRRVKTNDYYNPSKKGIAWERPVSIEFFRPGDSNGFTAECGMRVHASDYFRPRLRSTDKFSFTLYFRGDYGQGRLEYPFFTNCVVQEFNEIVLRAGSNDPLNPFLRDELVRRLAADTGQVASHGDFVNLFINGKYVKYYNPTERIEKAFCQAWQGGSEAWDVREQAGKMVEGTGAAFDSMMSFFNSRSFASAANYTEAGRRLDLTNFVDYLLPLLYADTGDWPHNNWRAARERVSEGLWRFYVWDAEWSFGLYSKAPSHNPFAEQLSGTSEIATLFTKLKANPEFRLLFADRAHQHLFNGGVLTDEHVRLRYNEWKSLIKPVIAGFDDSISTVWIAQRRRFFTNFIAAAGLLASSNAPAFSLRAGPVAAGSALSMRSPPANGLIYYTTDGTDPRVPVTGKPSATAHLYVASSVLVLNQSTILKARTLLGTTWSALTEGTFLVGNAGPQIRITEVMYHPLGGDAYQFIELQNVGSIPADLSAMSLSGVKFRFPGATPLLLPHARIVLISDENPALFAQRYPGVRVGGVFSGSLAHSGERLALVDRSGQVVTAVTYKDSAPWPKAADGQGPSLELVNLSGDSNNPASWRASPAAGGSPGGSNVTIVGPLNSNTDLSLEIEHLTGPAGYGLRFPAVAGRRYTIEFRESLMDGTWHTLIELPAQNATGTLNVLDPNPTGAMRYYRVIAATP